MAVTSLRAEARDLLSRLIQVDTMNPPGNETAAAELLRDYLEANGVSAACSRARPSARISSRGSPVAATARRFSCSRTPMSCSQTRASGRCRHSPAPWSTQEVWGRGALDMKGQVAASAVAIAALAREGFQPSGDVIFAATADEEVGDDFGLSWLCSEHPDAVRCDYAINEGAGDRLELGGSAYYLVGTAEKMSAPFRITVRGRSGHASMPGIADNALVKAARLVERIAAYRPEPQVQQEVAAFLETVLGAVPSPGSVVERARALHPTAADLVEPLLAPTFAPTMISASQKRNVIPASCEVVVDCRLLPGQHPEKVAPLVRAVLGGDVDYELEFLQAQGGTRSALDTPLWAAIASFVDRMDPGARPVPICVAGFTDSHWLRTAFGTVAYGFFPARTMPPALAAQLIHSADERVPVSDLELGVEWLRHVVRTVCA